MSLLDYILMGIVGATGTVAPAATPPTRTIDASAISQPRGGATGESLFASAVPQDTGGDKAAKKTTGKKPTKTAARRSHKRHHKGGAQSDALTVKQKSSNTSRQ
jgi:hypothetical protein